MVSLPDPAPRPVQQQAGAAAKNSQAQPARKSIRSMHPIPSYATGCALMTHMIGCPPCAVCSRPARGWVCTQAGQLRRQSV